MMISRRSFKYFRLSKILKFKLKFGSIVKFNSDIYNINDEVRVSISPGTPSSFIGYDNGLQGSSFGAPEEIDDFSLGNVPSAGFFQLIFHFEDGYSESHSLLIFDNGSNNNPNGSVTENIPQPDPDSFNNFYSFLKDQIENPVVDFKQIFLNSGEEYLLENTLTTSFTLALCITASPIPVLEIACVGQIENQARDFLLLFLSKFIDSLFDSQVIDSTQRSTFKDILNAAKATFSFFQVLNESRLTQLISAIAISDDITLSNNSSLNLSIQQSKQLYDITSFLIKNI